jgi:hypothetical protein
MISMEIISATISPVLAVNVQIQPQSDLFPPTLTLTDLFKNKSVERFGQFSKQRPPRHQSDLLPGHAPFNPKPPI